MTRIARRRSDRLSVARRFAQYLLIVALVVFAIRAFAGTVRDLSDLNPFRRALIFPWIAVAAIAEGLQYVSDGYFVGETFGLLGYRLSLKDTVRVAGVDVFAIAFLPVGQLGSLAAGLYLYRLLGLPTDLVLFYDVTAGALTGLTVVVLFVVALVALPRGIFSPRLTGLLLLTTVIVVAGACIAILMWRTQSQFRRTLSRSRWMGAAEAHITQWRGYFRTIAHHGTAFVTLVSAKNVAYCAIDVLALEACFLAFRSAPSPALVAAAYLVSLVSGYIVMTPAGLGAMDATLALVFLNTGIAPATVAGVILLFRLVNVVLPAPFGAWSFYSLRRRAAPATTDLS